MLIKKIIEYKYWAWRIKRVYKKIRAYAIKTNDKDTLEVLNYIKEKVIDLL